MNIHIHHFHSKGALADEAALEQFQKQWATYQKLVDADSLAHKEVGAILHGARRCSRTAYSDAVRHRSGKAHHIAFEGAGD
jgi:hypothetical protein